MNQQKQTLEYFKANAESWNEKAKDEDYSIIDNRHNAVLEVMKAYPKESSILDVGAERGNWLLKRIKWDGNQWGWIFRKK